MVKTGTRSLKVDAVVKSFGVKVLSKTAPGLGPKKSRSNTHVEGGGRLTWPGAPRPERVLPRKSRNENLSEAEKQDVTRFFSQIKTGRKCEMDILAYELFDISVGSIHCFLHRH